MKDLLGQEFKVGSIVVFTTNTSAATQAIGRITRLGNDRVQVATSMCDSEYFKPTYFQPQSILVISGLMDSLSDDVRTKMTELILKSNSFIDYTPVEKKVAFKYYIVLDKTKVYTLLKCTSTEDFHNKYKAMGLVWGECEWVNYGSQSNKYFTTYSRNAHMTLKAVRQFGFKGVDGETITTPTGIFK
jgi:hypothetical protein